MPTPTAAQVLGCSFVLLTPLWEGDEGGIGDVVLGGAVSDAGNELLVPVRRELCPGPADVANEVDVLEDGDILVGFEALLEGGDIVGILRWEGLLGLGDEVP